MMNPNTRLIDAARNDAPNDSRYDPIARALNTTCTKSCQVMDAAMSTSAANGINTTALRKNVVNPKVNPNPGSTLGCLMAAISRLTGAQRRYTDGGATHASHGWPWIGHPGLARSRDCAAQCDA